MKNRLKTALPQLQPNAFATGRNPFGASERVASLFSTHPSTEERVERLRAMAPGRATAPWGGARVLVR